MGHASLIKNIYIHTHTHIYSQICYNEQILSIISGCYNEHRCHNERGGIISFDVTHFFFFLAFIMESSITVFTRERLFMLFMCVRLFTLFIRGSLFIVFTKEILFMLFRFTCTVYKS